MNTTTFPTRSWRGDNSGWPEEALTQGDVRISGAVINAGVSWHAARDRLGWTTVALVGRPERAARTSGVDGVVRACADRCAPPLRTASELASYLRPWAEEVEIGVLRIGPHGRLVELLNLSLPTILHWDPHHGLCPYEPLSAGLAQLPRANTEMLRMEAGAVLLATTRGLLRHEAGWDELNHFVDGLSVDLFGGLIGDVAPAELTRLVNSSDVRGEGPAGMVAVGLPPAQALVA